MNSGDVQFSLLTEMIEHKSVPVVVTMDLFISSQRARRDEQLVRRLTRQTQQEQRLAAQLLQIRHQKEVILENRLFREEQFRQRRERDFQEALEREAVR